MTTNTLKGADKIHILAERLKQVPMVVRSAQRRGASVDAEAWQIATALADIEESANELFGDLVPKLLRDSSGSNADDVLNDVGEAYRHILYHILDTKMFDYVVPKD
jgi:hypothetical protein